MEVVTNKKNLPNEIPIKPKTAWMIVLFTLIGIIVLAIFLPPTKLPFINIPNTTGTDIEIENASVFENTTIIPFIQKLIILVKYDKTECPNLQIEHTNPSTNITVILDIDQVKNIEQEINYAELGRYDTNNLDIKPLINWVNVNNCKPQALVISNTEFIQLLLSYGVPVENKTVETNSVGDLNPSNETYEIKEEKYL